MVAINMSNLADGTHITALAASKLTGALPAISGAALTNLPSPPAADWSTIANKPNDLIRYSYTMDYHPVNLTTATTLQNWPRINVGGSCCYGTLTDKVASHTPMTVGSGMTGNFRVRFRGYRQEGTTNTSIYNGDTRLAHHSWGNGCCWQTLSTSDYYYFSLPPGQHTLQAWIGSNVRGMSVWIEYQLEFVSWS
jgi:hypothetical protein